MKGMARAGAVSLILTNFIGVLPTGATERGGTEASRLEPSPSPGQKHAQAQSAPEPRSAETPSAPTVHRSDDGRTGQGSAEPRPTATQPAPHTGSLKGATDQAGPEPRPPEKKK